MSCILFLSDSWMKGVQALQLAEAEPLPGSGAALLEDPSAPSLPRDISETEVLPPAALAPLEWEEQVQEGISARNVSSSFPPPLRNIANIAAGGAHTCARTDFGEVKCWGYNYFGQLGNGTRGGFSNTPVNVFGLNGWAIAAGGDHTCAMTSDGVKCWGVTTTVSWAMGRLQTAAGR
ncbi:MAG: hypothetical protein NZM18_03290 [Thermoflexales bacterium]|nr:hypothetical protein [Thermoflexales bacterium]